MLRKSFHSVKIMKNSVSVFFLISIFTGGIFNQPLSFAQTTQSKKVLTSFYPVYIMARNVAKDVPGVFVENMAPPFTGCLHDYALTPSDIKKFIQADIFIANGAGMESFLGNVIRQYPHVKVVELTEGISLCAGAEGNNPHVWLNVAYAITQVKNLGKAMREWDPAHALLYQKNTDAYVEKLIDLQEKMQTALAPYRGKKIITFHEAFAYFAQEFGLNIAAVIEREPGSAPNAKELAAIIDLVNREKIKAVFVEPQYPASAAEMIAKETGAKVYVLDPAVTGPDDLDVYIKIMEKNSEVLTQVFVE